MTDQTVTRDLGGFPGEAADLYSRNMWVGVRVWIAADLFFFFAFGFAFFYLRALNSNGGFHGANQNPSTGLGVAILVLTLVATGASWAGLGRLRTGNVSGFVPLGVAGVVAIVAAIVCQAWQFGQIGLNLHVYFGYASVYIGFAICFILHLIGCGLWLETSVAQAIRKTGRPATLVPGVEAFSAYFSFITGVGIIMFVLLYLIK
jgi:heme/copper-type cytochrome/quinol oxidase subunit 3